ncbi:MAG TPA: hypothetical protein VGJ62_00115 [Gemmatimonadaceae bacterium]|jgi:hypothetical protein
MSPQDNGPTNPLPDELDRALRQATDRTLSALISLRKAVRQHVRTSRGRGATFANIELDLRAIITRAQDGLSRRDGGDGGDGDGDGDGHHDALTIQVIKWSERFYTDDH